MIRALIARCGFENVFASDLKKPDKKMAGKFYILDVCKYGKYAKIIKDHNINYIIHLAAILSGKSSRKIFLASGEKNPALCRLVNTVGFENTLDIAVKHKCQ